MDKQEQIDRYIDNILDKIKGEIYIDGLKGSYMYIDKGKKRII